MKKPIVSSITFVCLLGLMFSLGADEVSALGPNDPADRTTFAVIGDYGRGSTTTKRVADLVKSFNPQFVTAVGNGYYSAAGGSSTTLYDESMGEFFCKYLAAITTTGTKCATGQAHINRFFPTLGITDYTNTNNSGGLPTVYTDYFTLPGSDFTNSSGNERYYDFVWGPVHFFMVNSGSSTCSTAEEPDGCTITSGQESWLETQLAASMAKWKIVMLHKAPFSSDTTYGDDTTLQWDYGDTLGADAVIAGRAHIYERIHPPDDLGAVYFVNGLGGRSHHNCGADTGGSAVCYDDDYGAQIVEATDTAINFSFYSTAGTLIDSHTISKADVPGDTCSTNVQFAAISDTYIDAGNPTTNYGSGTTLIADGQNDRAPILKWDVSSVPSGALVGRAEITIDVTNGSNETFEIYEMRREWVESEATWNIYGASNNWQTGGAQGANDRGGTVLGTTPINGATGSQTFALNAAGRTEVEDWITNASTNYGVTIQDYSVIDDFEFDSTETANVPQLEIDYCVPSSESLGDFVWDDIDRDGVQDGGEQGLVGVTVNLRKNSDSSLIQATTTVTNGLYIFSDVPTDSYYIEFVPPYKYGISPKDQGGNDALDSDADQTTGRTNTFSWTAGDPQDNDFDAGMYLSYVSNYVWRDTDGDGIQEGDETAPPGVTVRLLDSTGTSIDDQTVTDAGGNYRFYNPADNFIVEVVAPSGFSFGPKDQGGDDSLDSDANTDTGRTDVVAWTLGDTPNTDIDAGMTGPCTVTSFQDGIAPTASYDGTDDTYISENSPTINHGTDTILSMDGRESGTSDEAILIKWDVSAIPANDIVVDATIAVNLENRSDDFFYFWDIGQPWTENGATWNQYDGSNNWSGTDPRTDRGNFVGYFPPAESTGPHVSTLNGAGRNLIESWADNAANNNGLFMWAATGNDAQFDPHEDVIVTDRPKLTVQHCSEPDIGNEVWVDTDENGLQNAGEPAADDVTVRLWNTGIDKLIGGGDDVLEQTTQSEGGNSYGFWGVTTSDTYYVEVVAPALTSMSTQNVGGDDTIDSDTNPSTGYTAPFLWAAAIQNLDSGLHSGPVCYAVADSTDVVSNSSSEDYLISFDPLSGLGSFISGIGAVDIEALTWNPFSSTLYGMDGDDFGTIDETTGVFTSVGALGSCDYIQRSDSSAQSHEITDMDGLGINYTNGDFFGTARKNGLDLLVQIDETTGTIVQDSFGAGEDCVEIEEPSGNTSLTDIDDIGFGPSGTLYGVANEGDTETRIVTISLTNGDTTDLGTVSFQGSPLRDVEGLSFTETGVAVATTGQDADMETDNSAFEFDLTVNPIQATHLSSFNGYNTLQNSPISPPYVSYQDYEGLTCYGVSQTSTVTYGSIGNYVWLDENNDGVQDPGESGIPNVAVELWLPGNDGVLGTADDTLLSTTYTDAMGGYLFDTLTAGRYQVRIPSTNFDPNGPLEDRTQTTTPVNSGQDFGNQELADNGNGTNGYDIVLGFGEENLTADFGYNWNTDPEVNGGTGTAVIGDRVWIDIDSDGAQDANEIGLNGITVDLYNDDDNDGVYDNLVATTTTDQNGNYIFDGLTPDAYVVEVNSGSDPTGYTQTGDPDHFGAAAGTNDNRTTTPVVVGPGDVFLNADFGYVPSDLNADGSIGDFVWFDADADGLQTGESGIPGATVSLIRDLDGDGTWDAGEPVIATDTTDGNGAYLFDGLPVTDGSGTDDYLVWVNDTQAVLNNMGATADTRDGGAPGDPTTGLVTGLGISAVTDLTPTPVTDADFGYTADGQTDTQGLIGDTIYHDIDGNSTQDAGEPGLEGVVVELYASDGTTLLRTTTTDENGNYHFSNLDAATYVVRVASSLTANGSPIQGMSYTEDPDGAPLGESTVVLAAGEIDLDQDFGLYVTSNAGTIGDLVWLDENADGDVDASEIGIQGVTVDLYRDLNGNGEIDPGEPLVATDTTDASGNYLFTNLSTEDNDIGTAGADYIVHVSDTDDVLAGYWHSLGTAGTNDNSQADPYAVSITNASPDNLTADFGYYIEPAAVGNFVWDDRADADGVQDAGEPGIDGVIVELEIVYPGADGIIGTTDDTTVTLATVTGDDPSTPATEAGWFNFGNLLLDEDYNGDGVGAEPTYSISVASSNYDPGGALEGLWQTNLNRGGDANLDSDSPDGVSAQPVQGATDTGATNLTDPNASYDFGFVDIGTTPVTLSAFKSQSQGRIARLEWWTATETGNLGFYVFGERNGQIERVKDSIVPSAVLDSVAPQHYTLEIDDPGYSAYFVADVDLLNRRRSHGPFPAGETIGELPHVEPIPWGLLRTEADAAVDRQEAKALRATIERVASARREFRADDGGPAQKSSAAILDSSFDETAMESVVAELHLTQTGVARVTYEDFLAAGIDLRGVSSKEIAVTEQGVPVPTYVNGRGRRFGPGWMIEFRAEGLDTLYTDTNVYRVHVNRSLALRPTVARNRKVRDAKDWYVEERIQDRDLSYSPSSPGREPWYETWGYSLGGSVGIDVQIEVDALASSEKTVDVWMEVLGFSSWPEENDHHVALELNGERIAEGRFDGIAPYTLSGRVSTALLVDGINNLRLVILGDTGQEYDTIGIDRYGIEYPRKTKSVLGRLELTTRRATSVAITGAEGVAYGLRKDGSVLRVQGSGRNGTALILPAEDTPVRWSVAEGVSTITPEVRPGHPVSAALSEAADYVVIAHSMFLDSAPMQELMAMHEADGYRVSVVDLMDVMNVYGHGVFGAEPLREYVAESSRMRGAQYFLIVGGDTYDYRDRLGYGAFSLVPTLYAKTGPIAWFAPVDSLIADTDANGVPDVAIGRMPARTVDEFATLVQKTIDYRNKDYARTSLFVADEADGGLSFAAMSDDMVKKLPDGWVTSRAYLDTDGVAGARERLLREIEDGVSVVSYMGHSSSRAWTFQGLFDGARAKALTNVGRPTVVAQWGCWNTYFVSVRSNTLAHSLLLDGDRGAAAVLGASTLTEAAAEARLGKELVPRLVKRGVAIGDAITEAKASLHASGEGTEDVLLGWTLLGDPLLVVDPKE